MKSAQELAKERLAAMFGELVAKAEKPSKPRKKTSEERKAYRHEYYLAHKAEYKARAEKWKAEHREKYQSNALKWYHEHKEHCSEMNRKWQAEHREQVNERMRKWRKDNPDKCKAYKTNYLQKKKGQTNEQIPPAP